MKNPDDREGLLPLCASSCFEPAAIDERERLAKLIQFATLLDLYGRLDAATVLADSHERLLQSVVRAQTEGT